MDWWLIPLGLSVAVLLRLLWVAAFHPDETVSAMPELDGYVPGEQSATRPADGAAREDLPSDQSIPVEPPPGSGPTIVSEAEPAGDGVDARSVSTTDTETGADDEATDGGGTWIELDIEPLFPSSDRLQIVDLTEAEDPEVTP